MKTEPSIPSATYRVQLHPGFTLDDCADLVDYLADLGVSHLYCSPYLRSAPGSSHGYDVADHGTIDAELGGALALDRLVAELHARSMGHILDFVPNHMAATVRANRLWWEVLRDGRGSRYGKYFDIDWNPPPKKLEREVLVPILGDHYGRVLDAGDLKLAEDEGEVVVRYFEHVLPISPASLEEVRTEDEDLGACVERLNADRHALHELLEGQNYRLALWRTAGQELNYRRFFAINELVALRVEDPEVFTHVHGLVLELVKSGKLEGLRIDHIDGLREPQTYLERLRAAAPRAYIVVEKILEPEEELQPSWPVAGTTGYDFLNLVQGLFVDPTAEGPLTEFYLSFTQDSADLEESARAKRMQLMRTELATDVERLTDLFIDACERHPRHRDYTPVELRSALQETIAAFPVYRTYVDAETRRVTDTDRAYIAAAIGSARERRSDLDPELFDFLESILTLEVPGHAEDELALRFQQASGPVMAKGVEDTLFYTFNRFIALNEVGGDPGRFGTSVADFHDALAATSDRWPATMLATSTHDTKRSEDVRARLCLLSEIPERWIETVDRWSAMNRRHEVDGLPGADAEYHLYQTLVGAWPLSIDRTVEYMHKSSKEAKVHTSWIDADERYDVALERFVTAVLSDDGFVEDVDGFVAGIVEHGRVNALAQTLIKLTAPGVPDIYQGQELWDLSLVDPDNRRPVDYAMRRELLALVRSATWTDVATIADTGASKILVTQRALQVRAEMPDAFAGSYQPLEARGSKAGHAVAFCRGDRAVTIVPRLVIGRGRDWGDTTVALPEGRWRNVLTGAPDVTGEVRVGTLLAESPVALLIRSESSLA